jgi:type I restriction enzyme, S subunit
MSLSRFKSYKSSGVPWLGDVPTHWKMRRLRFVARLNPSKSEIADLTRSTEVSFLPMEAVGDDGSINLDHTRTIGEVETGYTYFRDGDVTFAKITPCFENGKGAVMRGLLGGLGFGTTELTVARPLPSETTSEYLHWLFASTLFRKRGEASMYGAGGQKRVPEEFVRDFAIAFPPVEEQQKIAGFLKRETAKIDALVGQQRRLIDLLREKRQGVISHSVTKGLIPNTALKDSGVDWLGMVPAHWQVLRYKAVFHEFDERSHAGDGELLTVSHLTGVTLRSEKNVNMIMAETLEGYKRCHAGDLVINTMWAWMGALGMSPCDGLVSPSYNVYRPRDLGSFDPSYYDYLCRIPTHVVAIKSRSTGVWESRLRLYPDAFLSLRGPLPPKREQEAIVAFLDRETARFDTLMAEAARGIDLLHERRAALISAAVAGKIDVRDFETVEGKEEVAA